MIVFCEYVIPDLHRNKFLAWAEKQAGLWEKAAFMENVEQPGVFVEIWKAEDGPDAQRIKKERLEGRSEWRQMEEWVKGGKEGLRLWTFNSVWREQ